MTEVSADVSDEVTVEESDEELLPAPSLGAALEALLIVAVEPQSTVDLAEATRYPVEEVAARLKELAAEYASQERGFALREVAGGWRFYTSESCSGMVERWVLDGQQARLTQAALETLAVIAYRQPVSRARISAVRGVNVDGVLRTLQSLGGAYDTHEAPHETPQLIPVLGDDDLFVCIGDSAFIPGWQR